jgi:hypothetical protein
MLMMIKKKQEKAKAKAEGLIPQKPRKKKAKKEQQGSVDK